MNLDLTGKTALVTGSTEGIGFAIAKGLAEHGARLLLNGRKEEKTAKAVERLKSQVSGVEADGLAGDLATSEGCKSVAERAGDVDILINNAGIFQPEDFYDADDETWDRHWQLNVMSGVRLSRALTPGMVDRGWGRVIFLGSESAYNIPAEMIHYGVTKTADVSLARGLAKRLADTGVTVNSVLPGPTRSEGFEAMFEDEIEKTGKSMEELGRKFVQENRPSSIIQRPATVEEVANLAVYLSSPAASATTGAAMRVDGGVIDSIV